MKRAALGGLLLIVALGGGVLAQAPKDAPQLVSLPDLHPGEGWQEIQVKTNGQLRARAWNDPAAGCNLASFEIPIPATAQIDPLAASFDKVLATKAMKSSELAREGDSLRLQLTGDNMKGIANMRLDRQSPTEGDSSASLLACYWNERDPERCATICQRLLDSP